MASIGRFFLGYDEPTWDKTFVAVKRGVLREVSAPPIFKVEFSRNILNVRLLRSIMVPRRTHTKSRNGCDGCKKRHVKCDESGPPCTNCIARELECKYSTADPLHHPTSVYSSSRL